MKKLFFIAAMASTLLTGCNKEDQIGQSAEGYLAISNVSASTMDTRAATAYTEDIVINLSGITDYEAVTGRVLTLADNWAITPAIPLGTDERVLTSWAPKTLTEKTPGDNTFALTSGVYSTANDLLFDNNSVNANTRSVDLVLEHAYSMITLKFVKNNIPAGVLPTLADVKLNVPASSTINIATGEVPAPEANADVVFTSGLFDADYAALVVPTASTPNVKVTCTINGKPYTLDLGSKITTLAKGVNYEVTMTYQGAILSVASVKATDWTTTPVVGGDLTDVI